MDGDARGGAALSIRHATGCPVKFIGPASGWTPSSRSARGDGLAHPRMGDVLSLVEKAEAVVDKEEAERMRRKVAKAELNFEDMLEQLRKVRKMGRSPRSWSCCPAGRSWRGCRSWTRRR